MKVCYRFDRVLDALARFRAGGGSGRTDRDHHFRYFSHKAIESADSIREGARTKGVVHAAVLLACLSQALAGVVLQHSLVVNRQ